MIRCAWLVGLVLVLSAGGGRPAAQSRPEVALRAAIETETIKGDLRGAIAQYRALAASPDRAIAAQALVRMADCHRKLGDAEARGLYERVVREFADQSEAVAAARAGLRETGAGESARGTATRGDRAVWTGNNVDMFGRVSPDGRYVTFVEWEKTGNLALRDLSTNTERLLTRYDGKPYSAWAEYSTISSDGSEVLYIWGLPGDGENQTRELRRLGLNGGSPKEPVTVFTAPSDLRFFGPLDWSKDKSFVATTMSKRDGTGQIVTIRVADGAVTVLRPVSWRGPDRLFLSPDARYLAYDLRVSETDPRSDVFVMDLTTRREAHAVQHAAGDGVLGWSPDGRHLLFTSDRTGADAIWAQALEEGSPSGQPVMLKPDGAGLSLGVTPSGTLYVYKIVSSRDVALADLDLAAGRLLKPRGFDRGFVARPRVPAWSRDGKRLAYPGGADGTVVIRDLEAGTTRELAGGLLFLRDPRWSPDGSRVLVASRDRQGRNGIFTIDVQSGAVETVVLGPPFGASPLWSGDGSKIYYLHKGLIERTLASGAERTLRPGTTRAVIEISPDGQWIAVLEASGGGLVGPGRILVMPTAGGEARQVLDVTAPDGVGPLRTMAWTADNRALLVIRTTPSGKRLWEVPVDGRPARALDIDAEIFATGAEGALDQGFALSPGGTQLAFLSGRTAYEVWAVENLLPALPPR